MAGETCDEALLLRAISGDRDATGQILWLHYERLWQHVGGRIPASLRRSIDADDILSQTFVDVWRQIRGFQPRGADAFFGWLCTIADRNLLDEVRAHRRAKRGGGRQLPDTRVGEGSKWGSLLDMAVAGGSSPSRQASRREAEQALRLALASLAEHYQEAVQLRYLQALPVADVAARMGRSEGAVLMLCQRALKKLRAAMGSSSRYLASDR